MNQDFFNIENALCFNLYKAHRLMNGFYRKHLFELNLTYCQFLVMASLWNEDGKTTKKIGLELNLDSGTLSPLLKRLKAQGLIVKERSAEDERLVCIFLTKEGESMREKGALIPTNMFNELGLSIEEYTRVLEKMKGLVDNLESGGGL